MREPLDGRLAAGDVALIPSTRVKELDLSSMLAPRLRDRAALPGRVHVSPIVGSVEPDAGAARSEEPRFGRFLAWDAADMGLATTLPCPAILKMLAPLAPRSSRSATSPCDSVASRFLGVVDLDFIPAEICGLIGPSGAGKTTLFVVLAGVRQPTSGVVEYQGETNYPPLAQVGTRHGTRRTFQRQQTFVRSRPSPTQIPGSVS